MTKHRIALAALSAASLALAAPGVASAATVTARATFDATTDTNKPVNNTTPRGSVTFRQVDNGPITATGRVTGLTPSRAYITVPYSDGGCAPLPGVTAFPSATWTTDATGASSFSVTVNPQAINPLANFTLDQTRSISIREALVPGQTGGPITTPTAPNPITEACDTAPRHHWSLSCRGQRSRCPSPRPPSPLFATTTALGSDSPCRLAP